MDTLQTLTLALGSSWAAGINLYAAVLTIGLMGSFGAIDLPPTMVTLQHPAVLSAAALMYCIEFFADKVPGVDSVWDSIHTFIRVPAGAILAAQSLGPVDPAWYLMAVLVGGGLAAGSHATKAGTRLLINTSPEPFTNIGASLTEDALVIGGLWTALHYPLVFLLFLLLFVALMIFVLPRIWRLLRKAFRWLTGSGKEASKA